MNSGALISDCGFYRYWLTRPGRSLIAERGPVLFIMLNPSTADAELDDPTIRRCRGFAESWGCAGLTVANLYAYRATDPAALRLCADPVGPDNDAHLVRLLREHGEAVCAWGNSAAPDRVREFMQLAEDLRI